MLIVAYWYFYSTRAFLIPAIVTAKIIYLGFLVSYTNRIALIIWISKVLSRLRSPLVSYIVLGLVLGSVLDAKLVLDLGLGLVLDLGLGFLSIFFIVEYQFF